MRKQVHKFGLISTMLAFTVISGSTVLALPPQAKAHADNSTTSTTSGTQTAADRKAAAQARIAAAKLRSCQNRQKAITNIMARISDRGQKQLTLFGTIATRVETFYTNKGKTLSNYDALVADVTAKQAAAQTAVTATTNASTGFTCDSPDPKAFVETFKTSLKAEITALKDYRTAVKNLIVGVKSVQGTTSSTKDTTTTPTTDQTTGGN